MRPSVQVHPWVKVQFLSSRSRGRVIFNSGLRGKHGPANNIESHCLVVWSQFRGLRRVAPKPPGSKPTMGHKKTRNETGHLPLSRFLGRICTVYLQTLASHKQDCHHKMWLVEFCCLRPGTRISNNVQPTLATISTIGAGDAGLDGYPKGSGGIPPTQLWLPPTSAG